MNGAEEVWIVLDSEEVNKKEINKLNRENMCIPKIFSGHIGNILKTYYC